MKNKFYFMQFIALGTVSSVYIVANQKFSSNGNVFTCYNIGTINEVNSSKVPNFLSEPKKLTFSLLPIRLEELSTKALEDIPEKYLFMEF